MKRVSRHIRAVPTDIPHFLARVVVQRATASPIVLEHLSGVSARPMIIRMATTSGPQQRYDHRLRNLVQRAGDLAIAVDLGVPRSTARGWLRAAPTVVVSLDVANRAESELREEILKLQQRVEKLAALLLDVNVPRMEPDSSPRRLDTPVRPGRVLP